MAMNQQVTMKPQDVVVLFKLIQRDSRFTYAELGKRLFLSASEVHSSIKRLASARLLTVDATRDLALMRAPIRDFVLFGARYTFPPVTGGLVRGMPTAYALPSVGAQLSLPDEPLPVWPYAKGTVRGTALFPLYPSVPQAAERDEKLYASLAVFDLLRVGGAREREIAVREFERMLQ